MRWRSGRALFDPLDGHHPAIDRAKYTQGDRRHVAMWVPKHHEKQNQCHGGDQSGPGIVVTNHQYACCENDQKQRHAFLGYEWIPTTVHYASLQKKISDLPLLWLSCQYS